jgi:hypothetical protein
MFSCSGAGVCLQGSSGAFCGACFDFRTKKDGLEVGDWLLGTSKVKAYFPDEN